MALVPKHKAVLEAEIQDCVKELKEMRDYAQKHGFANVTQHLNGIIAALGDVNKINYAKTLIIKAKSGIPSVHQNEIFNSLLKQKKSDVFQNIFESFNDFFSPLNKFEKVIGKHEKKHAANSSVFFSVKTIQVTDAPSEMKTSMAKIVKNKLK
jgi:hypothetical protein